MAGLSEIVLLLLALAGSLGAVALAMYIMYRIGIYVMSTFGAHKPGVPSESTENDL